MTRDEARTLAMLKADRESASVGLVPDGYRNFPGHSMCCRCDSCENANRNRDQWFPGDPFRAPHPEPRGGVDPFRSWLESEIDDASTDIGAAHQEGGRATEVEKERARTLAFVHEQYLALSESQS